MPSLRDLQRRFADDVLGDGTQAAPGMLASGSLGVEGIAIYRRTIRWNYRNALAATYPAVRRIVGTAPFHEAVDAYVAAHPSRSGDLNAYGGAFGDFLERHPRSAHLAHLPDVARLEWAIDEANLAADEHFAPDDVIGALTKVPAERLPALRLRMQSSCRFLSSRFPLLRIWQVNQDDHRGDLRVDFAAAPDHLRIRREQPRAAAGCVDSDGVAIERIDGGSFQWLAALAEGATLAGAIGRALNTDPAFDLQRALHRFIGDGTVAGFLSSRLPASR